MRLATAKRPIVAPLSASTSTARGTEAASASAASETPRPEQRHQHRGRQAAHAHEPHGAGRPDEQAEPEARGEDAGAALPRPEHVDREQREEHVEHADHDELGATDGEQDRHVGLRSRLAQPAERLGDERAHVLIGVAHVVVRSPDTECDQRGGRGHDRHREHGTVRVRSRP